MHTEVHRDEVKGLPSLSHIGMPAVEKYGHVVEPVVESRGMVLMKVWTDGILQTNNTW